jgi:hypothetical protein
MKGLWDQKCMLFPIVVQLFPTKGAHFDVRGSDAAKTLDEEVQVHKWTLEIRNPMGDTGGALVVCANGCQVGIESHVVFTGVCTVGLHR